MEWFVRWLAGFESMCVALVYERCCSSDYNYSISPALFLQRNTHTLHICHQSPRQSLSSNQIDLLLLAAPSSVLGSRKPVQQGVELQ